MASQNYLERIYGILKNDADANLSDTISPSQGPVRNVNLMPKENSVPHHTDLFHNVNNSLDTPIYRRGQPFTFTINFHDHFELADKNLRVDFDSGPEPLPGPGTLVQLYVGDRGEDGAGKNWSIEVKNKQDNSLVLEAKPSCACPIGVWNMTIVTTQPLKQDFKVPQHFYILFNPWCKDDTVYIEDEACRNEYVLNQSGMAFVDEYHNIGCYYWDYSQFFPVTLPAAVFALEILDRIKNSHFGDPILVTRGLSESVGCNVVEGKWDGDYSGGESPMAWNNSNNFLKIFMDTRAPVKFGQCWVFATITCSMARALGIPCRVITNYKSAHDTDKNLVIYSHHDENGMFIPSEYGGHRDSIWNFHVWNDAWMTRPDLPSGYGGWQAFDATPQEASDTGAAVCGPVSVLAIKQGEIGYQYDALFVYTEVNADEKKFRKDFFGQYEFVSMLKDTVGKLILTKAVGQETHEDVTNLYKHQEATEEERKSFNRAAQIIGVTITEDVDVMAAAKIDDVLINLFPVESVMIGKTFTISIEVANKSKEKRTVNVSLGADSIHYTGVLFEHLDINFVDFFSEDGSANLHKVKLVLAPEQKEMVKAEIEPKKYLDKLSPTGHMKFSASVLVDETKQVWIQNDSVTVLLPKLIVEVPNEVKVNQPLTVSIKFTNPLPNILRNCSFRVFGSCFKEGLNAKFRDVQPNENVVHEIQIPIKHTGRVSIGANFNSNLMTRLDGAKITNVIN